MHFHPVVILGRNFTSISKEANLWVFCSWWIVLHNVVYNIRVCNEQTEVRKGNLVKKCDLVYASNHFLLSICVLSNLDQFCLAVLFLWQIHVMSIDFSLLSTFAPFWIYNDMSTRKWWDFFYFISSIFNQNPEYVSKNFVSVGRGKALGFFLFQ